MMRAMKILLTATFVTETASLGAEPAGLGLESVFIFITATTMSFPTIILRETKHSGFSLFL